MLQILASLSGITGALLCVGMYAAVSLGRASAERPVFFIVNSAGALMVAFGAISQFDAGDLGTIGQELTWALLSAIGAARVLRARRRARPVRRLRRRMLAALAAARRASRRALRRGVVLAGVAGWLGQRFAA
jgi:hypothetical protein